MYHPNSGYTGIDSFTYKVTSNSVDSPLAEARIAVGGVFGAIITAPAIVSRPHAGTKWPDLHADPTGIGPEIDLSRGGNCRNERGSSRQGK